MYSIKNSARQSRASIRRVNFLVEENSYDNLCDGKKHLWEKLIGLIGEKFCKEKVQNDGKLFKRAIKINLF